MSRKTPENMSDSSDSPMPHLPLNKLLRLGQMKGTDVLEGHLNDLVQSRSAMPYSPDQPSCRRSPTTF